MEPIRCPWATGSSLEMEYHDNQWGKPVHDDKILFEMLTLEGMQAGLSWATILKKRDGIKKAFDQFDLQRIIQYDDKKIESLMKNPDIIRNRLKIQSVIRNAKGFLAIQKEFGSFDAYIWSYVNGTPIINQFKTIEEIPAQTPLSAAISKDLKKRDFNFVGPTIIYAFMQATGMVNDHLVSCHFR